MGFRNFGKTQLGKYSADFNWEGVAKKPPCLADALDVVLGLHIFRNFPEKKIYIAAVNILKSGPIFCVKS